MRTLRLRGPDGEGEWTSAALPAWLGHRRLAIIDLSESGRQPMAHPDRDDLVITFNGEIYNYLDLKRELERAGHRFRSASDTEVLLHAYVAWGEAMLDRIHGMFAFALFDGAERKLLLTRDAVGQKPLYYLEGDDSLAFASTPDALRCLSPSGFRLSAEGVCHVLTLGYVPAPHSIWSGVKVVRPGEYVVWQEGRPLRTGTYWSPPKEITDAALQVEEFADLFQGICAEHTLADVPVGLFLSGGLDSTSVACALHDAERPLECFTLGFANSHESEHPVASAVADHLGFTDRLLTLETKSIDELRETVARIVPEPQAYSALLTMHAIAETAATQRKVMLSGDGGDELFGGYTWYSKRDASLQRRALGFLRLFRSGSAISRTGPLAMENFARQSLLHRHALNVFRRFLPHEATALFASLSPHFDEEAMLAPLAEHYIPTLPRQNALQRIDLMTFCSGSVLAKVDRMSMAHSLEVRAPFLDRRLIDWALGHAAEPAVRGRQKPVLRHYLAPRAPGEVFTHPKRGFSMKGLSGYDHRALLGEVARSRMVRDGILSKDFHRHVDAETSFGRARLWTLAAVTSWYEHHA